MDTIIRHYQPGDQAAITELSADTAYFGDPVEAFLEDRRLYIDAFARYYTDCEADYAWVAENPQGVIGFLFGCVDTKIQMKRWRGYIVTHALVQAISGRYRLGKLTAGFAAGMLLGFFRGEAPALDLARYPAHLQIDVKTGHREMGVGRELIKAYLEQLRQSGIVGVHLVTTSANLAAMHLYEKVGFRLLDQRRNRYWTRRLGFQVENRTYGLNLT
ncbi:MAG: hypothetical protein A2136_04335 [Chloroflexi bacterium RBG_16_54_11]|nr:MAG: hypothetical protein A2136_04335 [Chloroflexi bacterium RBG_16_54_11]